jgi:hypothetical protein
MYWDKKATAYGTGPLVLTRLAPQYEESESRITSDVATSDAVLAAVLAAAAELDEAAAAATAASSVPKKQ